MPITRRDFIGSVVGAAGGLMLSQVPFRRLAGLDDVAPYEAAYEQERFLRSACQLCHGGCGIEVRLVDGQPVSIRGNPLHPVNRGGLCPVGIEGLHVLHHPDRLRSPLRRAGDRGSGQWMRISWDEALQEMADRLGGLVSAGRGSSIVALDGAAPGLMPRLWERFLEALGSANHVRDLPPDGLPAMMSLAQGVPRRPAYDLENAEVVLSFGAPLLEGWRSPLQGQRGYAALRGATGPRRRRFYQVDTRRSLTATRADEWIAVRPGAYGALALTIAYVIIREGLYDAEFIDRHTYGFESGEDASGRMRRGFREHVLYNYRPDRTVEITGVPPEVVVELAKEFATADRAVAVVDHAATQYSNGLETALAIHALNALVGSIDRSGGAVVAEQVPFADWPPVDAARADAPAAGERIDGAGQRFPLSASSVGAIPSAILGEERDVGALLLHYSNPCFSLPDPDRFTRALARIPFVVSFTPFPDETSHYADLILPDHTYLERWQDVVAPDSFPYATMGICRPVVEPLYDTRHTGDVILSVAGRIGGPVAEALPWNSFEEVLHDSARAIFEAGRGTVLADEHTSAEVRELEMRGWWLPKHDSFEEFWRDAVEKGGWWDPAYVFGLWGRVLQTPSRRFEFRSQRLEQLILERATGQADPTVAVDPERLRAALDGYGLKGEVEEVFLPHHEPAVFDGFQGERDFHLNPYRPLVPNSGLVPDLPWVREALNPRVAWDTWAEIHPEDATQLGLSDGQWIWLVSPVGRLRVRALIGHDAEPGVINVPYGLGREVAGRWGMQRGANPNRLIAGEVEALAAIPRSQSMMVRIETDGPGGARG